MMTPNWHEPFSPTILETKVPDKFIKTVNHASDVVLNDTTKSVKWDFSDSLVGKVHKEIQIPFKEQEDAEYCSNILKQASLDYLKYMIEKNRAFHWNKLTNNSGVIPSLENIVLNRSWVVSQYKHEYNPWHTHSGDFSGVIYLKLPEGMEDHFNEETKDHYPASGLIDFKYGEKHDLRTDTLMMKPEVGMMMVFPSWLNHSVYPFYCDGERRSMSFNSFMKAGEKRVVGVNTI